MPETCKRAKKQEKMNQKYLCRGVSKTISLKSEANGF